MKRLLIASVLSLAVTGVYAQQQPPYTPSPTVVEYVKQRQAAYAAQQAANAVHDAVLYETSGQVSAIIVALNEFTAKFETFIAKYDADITTLKATATATTEQLNQLEVDVATVKEAIDAMVKMAGLTEAQLRTMLIAILQQ